MEGSSWLMGIALLLIAWGFFNAGQLWESRKTEYWKVLWTLNEEKLARIQLGREKRECR